MKVTKNSTPRVVAPEGNHIAILTQILDWGTQTDSFGARRKVEFIWELPEETHVFKEEDGPQPFILDRKFALTIGKGSALGECLGGLAGTKITEDELELEEYLGTVGMINVKHEQDGDYTNAVHTSYSPLSKSDAKRKFKPVGEYKMLDLDNFDQEVFDSLPDWKQKAIAKSPEYQELVRSKVAKTVTEGSKNNQQAAASAAPAKGTKAQAPVKQTAKSGGKSTTKAGKLFK